MALRMLGRRVGLELKSVLRPGRQQTRGYAEEYTGKPLSEKEKAAETAYIRKKEEEQRLKLSQKGVQEGLTGAQPTTPSPETLPKAANPVQAAEGGYRNIAVVAGLVAAVAGYWLLSGSSKKEEKDSA